MSKKRNGIIATLSIIILLFIGLIPLIFNGNTSIAAFPYSEGRFAYIGALTTNPNLYCINKGKEWRKGNYYCYLVEDADPVLAYLVAQQGEGRRDPETDPIANAIWDYLAGVRNPLVEEARMVQQIESGNNISITGPENPVIGEGNGYGPFVVNYPTTNNKMIGKVTMMVNGQQYSNIPASGTPFYLTENDGIIYGQENSIELIYNSTVYAGTAGYLRPASELVKVITCPQCEYSCNATLAEGVITDDDDVIPYGCTWEIDYDDAEHRIVYGYVENDEGNRVLEELWKCPYYDNNTWRTSWESSSPELSADEIYNSTASGRGPGWQDVVYVQPEAIELEPEEKIISFWAGKPDIEIDLNKVNPEGEELAGAEFSISVNGGTVDGNTTITTAVDSDNTIRIKPDESATEVTVTLTEKKAPDGYAKLNEPIEIEYRWNATTKQWESITQDFTFESGENVIIKKETSTRQSANCVDIFELTAENRRRIIINLRKTDNAEDANALSNVTFDIDVSGGECEEESVITDENGETQFLIIPEGTGKVTLTLTEHLPDAESKFYKEIDPIRIEFTYSDGEWTPTIPNAIKDYISIEGDTIEFDLEIKNTAIIEDVTLIKVNSSVPEETISGVTFDITLENALTSDGEDEIINVKTTNGEIELGRLDIIDPNENIKITLRETGTPQNSGVNYKGLDSAVTITFKHKVAGCKVDNSAVTTEYDMKTNTIALTVENVVTIDLSGKVWLDGQTGIKPVDEPNNQFDAGTEKGIDGVTVILRKVSDNSEVDRTVTKNGGQYEFKDVPASINANNKNYQYYVEFEYDGVNYIAVTPNQGAETVDSDADENQNERNAFNNKFNTITRNKASGLNNDLKYNYTATTAELITTDGNGVIKDFAMIATTQNVGNVYNKNTENIDLGLVKKGVDLATVTSLEKATVTINGKTTPYPYNELAELNNNITITGRQEPIYNLYLYSSDYNYRIDDYQLMGTNADPLSTNTPFQNSRTEADELQVLLEYRILLNNQSATSATINEIAYYYDTGLVFAGIDKNVQYNEVGTEVIDGITYNKIIFYPEELLDDTINQEKYLLSFIVGKDANGALNKVNDVNGIKNWVEITSYSADEGCVDINSAPDNISDTVKRELGIAANHVEDDMDDAGGLKIELQEDPERIITGYVFEDTKTGNYGIGDGILAANEVPVNDVIVQLIEIKEVDIDSDTVADYRLEYIWQETVSGSSTIKYVTVDGKNISQITGITNADGQYTFKGFIPGNYIVRFIYGDKTYYDTSIDGNAMTSDQQANIRQYNGQDYKSTKDTAYWTVYYSEGDYAPNTSRARDNEARRLEVMGYATALTEEELEAGALNINTVDTSNKLDKTWMCAETSQISVQITDNATQVAKANSQMQNVVEKKDINFGLVRRSQPALKLEKHVTYLKIENVTEVAVDISAYSGLTSPYEVPVSDYYGGLVGKAIATNKGDQDQENGNTIGKWQVETNLTQYGVGPRVDIQYTYLAQNVGDKDYIGEKLNSELQTATYQEIANTVKDNRRKINSSGYSIGQYVGDVYYSGNISSTSGEVEVGIPVSIEDYLGSSNNAQTMKFEQNGTFTVVEEAAQCDIILNNNAAAKEIVKVLKSDRMELIAGSTPIQLNLSTYQDHMNLTNGKKEFTYRSYATQLDFPKDGMNTSRTGIVAKETMEGLQYVQSYLSSVPTTDVAPGDDEFIAETIVVTMPTGEDRSVTAQDTNNTNNTSVIVVSVAAGLAVIVVGIVLIKKFIIK